MLHLQMLQCMHCLVAAMGIEMEQIVIGIPTDLRRIVWNRDQGLGYTVPETPQKSPGFS